MQLGNKQTTINNNIMQKKQTKFVGGGTPYLAPELEILEVSVEQGFAGSYGDEGAAGGDLEEDNYGDY